ncbi:hypothetical protein QYE76_023928 [Lolium multiflorum]|uniref:GRF-type domain-containing protein n=1 Tax=Lolium multiflorum TaxID=4521 RepID=A0AAD8VUL0_LOLMU|nr:hypothetical protein QYE76_023928 [Lolium multiflorum]
MSPSCNSVGRSINSAAHFAPLPLMRCPFCGDSDVEWWVSKTKENPGKHFYKCEHEWSKTCNFWQWEEDYIQYVRAKWPRLVIIDKLKKRSNHGKHETDVKLFFFLALANFAALLFTVHKYM